MPGMILGIRKDANDKMIIRLKLSCLISVKGGREQFRLSGGAEIGEKGNSLDK